MANVGQPFTGYGRDEETGLDFAIDHYYLSWRGQLTSPDPLLLSSDVDDPQMWNRYSYALNNPRKFTDPMGLHGTLRQGMI